MDSELLRIVSDFVNRFDTIEEAQKHLNELEEALNQTPTQSSQRNVFDSQEKPPL